LGSFGRTRDSTSCCAHSHAVHETSACRVELRDGYIRADDVSSLFADVDALVVPYRSATGSQAVWTGFEFGVPVLATKAGSLASSVRDGVDGLVAEPDDVDSLASALTRFYAPGVPEKMRRAVRPVDRGLCWDRYLEVLLNSIDSGRRKRGPAEGTV
jgi:glycosyltransferase involved in cell wall biosynthesis